MDSETLFRRYQELQQYVGWTEEDARRVVAVAPLLEPCLSALIDDFYAEIERHPGAREVITGGQAQIERLKGTLRGWLHELLHGPYDKEYVARRWRVGWRHVEIGLDQVYTNVALSRLRRGLLQAHEEHFQGNLREALATRRALNMLLDLDLAIIEDAYQTEYLARQQRSERLATIGQVAAGVAHEIRNPLASIKGAAQFVQKDLEGAAGKEEAKEYLQLLVGEVDRLNGVVESFLTYARPVEPRRQDVLLDAFLKDLLRLHAAALPASIKIETTFDPDLPPVSADPALLTHAVTNAIRNAAEAMPEGGTLSIRTGGVASALRNWAAIEVEDTGPGIPRQDLDRLFQPFFTTKAKGTGLGLAISMRILEAHGGDIVVDNVKPRGCRFTFFLPHSVL